METPVLELLNKFFLEEDLSLILEKGNDNIKKLENCLGQLCLTVTPSSLFSSKAFKSATTKDLLLTVQVLVNYNFVIRWFFVSEASLESPFNGNAALNLCKIVYSNASIPELPEDTRFNETGYVGPSLCAELGLEIFCKLIQFMNNEENEIKAIQRYNVIIYSLLLCLEHLEEHNWSNENCTKLSKQLQEHILHSTSLKDLLFKQSAWHENSSCIEDMLKLILPSLNRSNWKQNPAKTFVLHKLLHNLDFTVDCGLTLPPTLLLMDDFDDENVSMGLDCLNCIMNNASKSELKHFGRIEVIYVSLMKLLCSKNELILDKVFSNLSLVLQITSTKSQDFGKEDKCEKTLNQILKQMQIENDIVLRRTYCLHLCDFVKSSGLNSLKLGKFFLDVIFAYLECYDGKQEVCRVNVLNALHHLIKNIWPRIHLRALDIVKSLIRLLRELSTPSYDGEASVHEIMLTLIRDCLTTLHHLVPEIKHSIDSVLTLNLGDKFRCNLQNMFTKNI